MFFAVAAYLTGIALKTLMLPFWQFCSDCLHFRDPGAAFQRGSPGSKG